MRDPKRIDGVLAAVKNLWEKYPGMRLGQLIWGIAGRDPFYMEDDELVKRSGGWDSNEQKSMRRQKCNKCGLLYDTPYGPVVNCPRCLSTDVEQNGVTEK